MMITSNKKLISNTNSIKGPEEAAAEIERLVSQSQTDYLFKEIMNSTLELCKKNTGHEDNIYMLEYFKGIIEEKESNLIASVKAKVTAPTPLATIPSSAILNNPSVTNPPVAIGTSPQSINSTKISTAEKDAEGTLAAITKARAATAQAKLTTGADRIAIAREYQKAAIVEAKRLKGIAKLEKSAGKRKTIDDNKALDVVGKMADRLHVKEVVEESVAADINSLRGRDNRSDINNNDNNNDNNNSNNNSSSSSTRPYESISSSNSKFNNDMSPLNIDPDVLVNLNKINRETSIDDKKVRMFRFCFVIVYGSFIPHYH
jgi:hypothetical protein